MLLDAMVRACRPRITSAAAAAVRLERFADEKAPHACADRIVIRQQFGGVRHAPWRLAARVS